MSNLESYFQNIVKHLLDQGGNNALTIPSLLISDIKFELQSNKYPKLLECKLRTKETVFSSANGAMLASFLDSTDFYNVVRKSLSKALRQEVYPIEPIELAQSFNLLETDCYFPRHTDCNNMTVLIVMNGSDQVLDLFMPCILLKHIYRNIDVHRKEHQMKRKFRIVDRILKSLSILLSNRIEIELCAGSVIIFNGRLCPHRIRNPNHSKGSHIVFAYDTTSHFDYSHLYEAYYGKV